MPNKMTEAGARAAREAPHCASCASKIQGSVKDSFGLGDSLYTSRLKSESRSCPDCIAIIALAVYEAMVGEISNEDMATCKRDAEGRTGKIVSLSVRDKTQYRKLRAALLALPREGE